MPDTFDPEEMVVRFRERAAAVRKRGVPPIEGSERRRFVEAMETDFMDYAIIGDATVALDDGILTLTVDLRPPAHSEEASSAPDE